MDVLACLPCARLLTRCQYIFCIDLLRFLRYPQTTMKQETEGLHIRVSPEMAEKLRQSVAKCGRGMSQGLFLERCFDTAGNGIVLAVQMARRMEKEPTR